MNKKTVEVSFETALEWYKRGGFSKELALQIFSEKELSEPWRKIDTYEKVKRTLGIPNDDIDMPRHIRSRYMVDNIRYALNGFWTKFDSKSKIYYPKLIYGEKEASVGSYTYNIEDINDYVYVGELRNTKLNQDYIILGYVQSEEEKELSPGAALFGCKSYDIAIHFLIYFGKQIFDTLYGHIEDYRWNEIERIY